MVYLILFIEFFKTGLFAIGGGLATLPFLYDMADKYTWFENGVLADMIAVSESTPGPIGINMATYAGFNGAGIIGGIIATVALVLPSLIVIIIIARFLEKFKENKYVQRAFYGLRPAVAALIAVAGFQVLKLTIFPENTINVKSTILFIALLYFTNKFKKHPIVYIAIGAFVGILFKL